MPLPAFQLFQIHLRHLALHYLLLLFPRPLPLHHSLAHLIQLLDFGTLDVGAALYSGILCHYPKLLGPPLDPQPQGLFLLLQFLKLRSSISLNVFPLGDSLRLKLVVVVIHKDAMQV